MKELEKLNRDTDRLQIEAEIKVKKATELKFDSSLRPMSGHTLFEINVKTGEIVPAKHAVKKTVSWNEALDIINGIVNTKDIVIHKDCVYISALNKESALNRYQKQKGSAKKEGKQKLTIL